MTKGFVGLIIGSSKSDHFGAQGTFKRGIGHYLGLEDWSRVRG